MSVDLRPRGVISDLNRGVLNKARSPCDGRNPRHNGTVNSGSAGGSEVSQSGTPLGRSPVPAFQRFERTSAFGQCWKACSTAIRITVAQVYRVREFLTGQVIGDVGGSRPSWWCSRGSRRRRSSGRSAVLAARAVAGSAQASMPFVISSTAYALAFKVAVANQTSATLSIGRAHSEWRSPPVSMETGKWRRPCADRGALAPRVNFLGF